MDYSPTIIYIAINIWTTFLPYYIAIYMGYIIWQNGVLCLCLEGNSAAMWSSLFCRWG